MIEKLSQSDQKICLFQRERERERERERASVHVLIYTNEMTKIHVLNIFHIYYDYGSKSVVLHLLNNSEIIPQLLRQQKKTIQTSPSTESSKQRDNLIYSVKCEAHAV